MGGEGLWSKGEFPVPVAQILSPHLTEGCLWAALGTVPPPGLGPPSPQPRLHLRGPCQSPAGRALLHTAARPGGALPTISPLGWPGPALQPCVSLGLESLSRWGRASCLRSVPRGLYCLARGCPHADSGGPPWSQRAGRACHQRPLWRGAAEPQACAACGMKAGDSRGRSEGAQLGLVGGGQWRPGAQHGHPTGLWDGCPAELPA